MRRLGESYLKDPIQVFVGSLDLAVSMVILVNTVKIWAICSKLTTFLVNKTLNFQRYYTQKCCNFLLKKCEELLQCKSCSQFFSKKNIIAVDFVSTVRLKSSANDFFKMTML